MKGNTVSGQKKETLNKSFHGVDSITTLAKQAEKSKKFKAQNSEAAVLFCGRNILHLISVLPSDKIYRKSITS